MDFDRRANLGKRGRKRDHAAVLRRVADLAPALVVAVLLAAFCVAAAGLDVAVGEWTDPDVLPRRGDGERADARQRRLVVDRVAARGQVFEVGSDPLSPNAWTFIADIPQPRGLRADLRIDL